MPPPWSDETASSEAASRLTAASLAAAWHAAVAPMADAPGLYHQSPRAPPETMRDGPLPSSGPTIHPPPWSAERATTSPSTPSAAASASMRSTGEEGATKLHDAAASSSPGSFPPSTNST